MFKSKKITLIFILGLIIVFVTLVLHQNFLKHTDQYGFADFKMPNKKRNDISMAEWENAMRKTKKTIKLENMDDIVISIGERKITRKEYESVRIRQKDIFSYTVKETVYSIVKDCVIVQEAERLNLIPDQKKIEHYMDGIYDALESDNELGFEFENSRIKILEMTKEEYIDEQERVAYELYQKGALYEHLGNDDKIFDKYVKKLLSSADIEIYDLKIKEACLKD